MKLEFLMQLELYCTSGHEKLLKVENQQVMIGEEVFVNLAKIPFAKLNERYRELGEEVLGLTKEIEELHSELKINPQHPDIEKLQSKLQKKLASKNDKQEKFDKLQIELLDTSYKVSKLVNETRSSKLHEAIDCFNNGKLEKTNLLLEQILEQKEEAFNEYDKAREVSEKVDEVLKEKRNGILEILDSVDARLTF